MDAGAWIALATLVSGNLVAIGGACFLLAHELAKRDRQILKLQMEIKAIKHLMKLPGSDEDDSPDTLSMEDSA